MSATTMTFRLLLWYPTVLLLWCWTGSAQESVGPQEQFTIEAVARLTWDEIVRFDVANRHLEEPRVVPPPRKGPGPREIGAPHDTQLAPEAFVPPKRRREHQEEVKPDITEVMLPPVLDFQALPDNNTLIPPDTHGAIGPSHAMTMLNSEVRIQTKTGATINTVSLASFWSAIAGSKFDPKVFYDAGSSRWFAVVDVNPNSVSSAIGFAMSAGSDPTGTWDFYAIDADPVNTTWADYPGVGFNQHWIAITQNMFTVSGSPGFVGVKMWVLDKATVLDGPPISGWVFGSTFTQVGGVYSFTLQPCHTFGSEPILYFVDNTGFWDGTTFMIRISRLTNPPPATPAWAPIDGGPAPGTGLFFVANNFNFTQINAAQMGSGALIATNDPRMLNAVYRNGRIWCTHSGGLPAGSPANRTAVFWYQLNPTVSSPIVQSGVIDGDVGRHHYFPSITANSANDAAIGFTCSDATMFAQAVFTGRLSTDPINTMQTVQLIKAGEGPYSKTFGGGSHRWGDFSATVVDPVDDLSFWTIQEYAMPNVGGTGDGSGRWGTWWAKLDPDISLPIQLMYFTASATSATTVLLEWGTLSEVSNYGFQIEKSLSTPENYTLVPNSFVPGHGTTIEPHHYSFVDVTATPGHWWYRLKQIDLDGTVNYFDGVEVDVLTDVTSNTTMPRATFLAQNHPNPFNPATEIRYSLAAPGHVTLAVYNLLGQEVASLVDGERQAGEHVVQWSPKNIASGTYLYRLHAGGYAAVRKLLITK